MFTDVRAVAVGVTDTDAAIAFFSEHLGFEVRMDVPMSETMRWVEVAAPGATTSVALLASNGPPPGIDTGIRFVVDDAVASHARLGAAGWLSVADPRVAATFLNWLVMGEPVNRAMLLGDERLHGARLERLDLLVA